MTEDANDQRTPTGWLSPNVWARANEVGGNPVRQLLVPASRFPCVIDDDGSPSISNEFGMWSAVPAGQATTRRDLFAHVASSLSTGGVLSGARWNNPTEQTGWTPADVLATYETALSYEEASPEYPGLRSPQLGALHAVLGYWTTRRKVPSTVVMPTGTGKTETMLALLIAARLPRLLVLVPSDALRGQVAAKFESLGVLQQLGIVTPTAMRPVVGRLEHGLTSDADAATFAMSCNVIVATPNALAACDDVARTALFDACSHLFIDEAHHVAADTWSSVRDAFTGKDVVQFTATPFREDGRHLQGRIVYEFPLREAQRQGYFSTIDYTAVVELGDMDQAVAEQAIRRLQSDLDNGYDHIIMARVSSIARAKEVVQVYQRLAPELNPRVLASTLPTRRQQESLTELRSRASRIVVCINMLGEGFDLPALKVAAVHDPHKSLGVTLQFIGRFARTSESGDYGPASTFVARRDIDVDTRLRELYAEDADWNHILRNLTEEYVAEQQAVSDFEAGFTSQPEEVAVRSLLPKLSTVVYRTSTDEWDPLALVEFFGEENLLTLPIGLNPSEGVAWCVVQDREQVRWGDIKTIEEVSYQLFVVYFDSDRRLLYVNNSANDGVFEELVEAVAGEGAVMFSGSDVYRVMADIDRLVPTNVGVLDTYDQFRRFSMHVGADVTSSFSEAEASTKIQTNISGGGYRDGEQVNISASLKGRIWSHAAATSLRHWCTWCDEIGTKLLDDSISVVDVIGQFILPQTLTERPDATLLAVEWPPEVLLQQSSTLTLDYDDKSYGSGYVDLVPDVSNSTGPLRFSLSTPAWSVPYKAEIANERLNFSCEEEHEVLVSRGSRKVPFTDWANENGLGFILDGDRVISHGVLLEPTRGKEPFSRQRLTPLDWSGVDLSKESQTHHRYEDSIQARAIRELLANGTDWDVVLDDDGSGEIADVVALKIDGGQLRIRLLHCKYSHAVDPGARVADLYEVCGQAQKAVAWRRNDLAPFFRRLNERAQRRQERTGVSPFEVGDVRDLFRLRETSHGLRRSMDMVIVQPGLSAAGASSAQLDLLASTEAYLRTTIKADLHVWCST